MVDEIPDMKERFYESLESLVLNVMSEIKLLLYIINICMHNIQNLLLLFAISYDICVIIVKRVRKAALKISAIL